jgi:DNA-binding transcriptional MerR regulator
MTPEIMEYLSVMELSQKSGIPRTTVRRWLKQFEEFFPSEVNDDRIVYAPDTVRTLRWIERQRQRGLTFAEIKSSWIRSLVRMAIEDDDAIRSLDRENIRLKREAKVWQESRERWSQNYRELHQRARTANLWQRIFRTW